MAVNKNLMAKLYKLEGAVTERRNIHADVIRTSSPSFNFCFGNGWGLPKGYTLVMYGPPKGGKSVILKEMIAQMHKDDPDAVAIVFNTEFRECQLSPVQAQKIGIDLERYISYEVNTPDLIFDRIEKEIAGLCQDGLKVGLVAIDSVSGVQGRRAMNADSIMTQQIGDNALTIQDGLKRILPIQRKHNFALVLTTQVRAEMDVLEQKRGNKLKMNASFGLQHHAEYFLMVEMDRTVEGKTDLLGNKFEDENLTDLRDNAERTGHKIRFCLKDSSMGPKGRVGSFTYDYDKGVVAQHEEVFLLGVNRNVIVKPNNMSFEFGGRKWVGKPSMIQALKEDRDLYEAVLRELRNRDLAGLYAHDETTQVEPAPVTEPPKP